MEITKGKWMALAESIKDEKGFIATCYINTKDRYIGRKEASENATLIADAGNTFQQTNKLPSELAEANKELLEALKSILKSHRQMSFEKDHHLNDTFIESKIDNLIKKHSNA
jgi:hypothetical protein